MNESEEFICDKVEEERWLMAGDFKKAVIAFWFCFKYLITSKEMYSIKIDKFGWYEPNFVFINTHLRRLINTYWTAVEPLKTGYRRKIKEMLVVRRRLINEGKVNKLYLLEKMVVHGKTKDVREGARIACEGIRGRIKRVRKAV